LALVVKIGSALTRQLMDENRMRVVAGARETTVLFRGEKSKKIPTG
jgi:hypothetical protein